MEPEDHSEKVKFPCNPQIKAAERDPDVYGVCLRTCTSMTNLQSFINRPGGYSVNFSETMNSLLEQSRAAEKKKLVWERRRSRDPCKVSSCAQPSGQCQHGAGADLDSLLQKSGADLDSLLQKSRAAESIQLKKWQHCKKRFLALKYGGDSSVQESTGNSLQGAEDEHEATGKFDKGKERNSSKELALCLQSPGQEEHEMGTAANDDGGKRNSSIQESDLVQAACQAASNSSSVAVPEKAPRRRKRVSRVCYPDNRRYRKIRQDEDELPQPKRIRLDLSEKCEAVVAKGKKRQRPKPGTSDGAKPFSGRNISQRLSSSVTTSAARLMQSSNQIKQEDCKKTSSISDDDANEKLHLS